MRPSEGFTQRLSRAYFYWQSVVGPRTQGDLGRDAAAAIGRGKPFSQATASDWFTAGVRDIDTVWGIARATGVRFAWLAADEGPMLDAVPGNSYPRPVAPWRAPASGEPQTPAAPAPSGTGFVVPDEGRAAQAVSFERPAAKDARPPAAKPQKRAGGEKKRRG